MKIKLELRIHPQTREEEISLEDLDINEDQWVTMIDEEKEIFIYSHVMNQYRRPY